MRARPGEWDLPGGTIDDHEAVEVGIIREVCEETGLKIDSIEKVSEFSFEHGGEHHTFYYYRGHTNEPKPVLSHEHDLYEWHEPLVASTMIGYKPHLLGYEHGTTNGHW